MRTFAILPAAGRSRRMGQPKLLLPWGGSTIIDQVVRNWKASRAAQVIAVLHAADIELRAACQGAGAVTVCPDPPPAEMKDSIRHGLALAEADFGAGRGDVWIVAPADMPLLAPEIIDRLIATCEPAIKDNADDARIWIAGHEGRRGHPVLLPWSLAGEVGALGDHEGLNVVLARHPVELVEVGTPAIFTDIDTPADYQSRRPESS